MAALGVRNVPTYEDWTVQDIFWGMALLGMAQHRVYKMRTIMPWRVVMKIKLMYTKCLHPVWYTVGGQQMLATTYLFVCSFFQLKQLYW